MWTARFVGARRPISAFGPPDATHFYVLHRFLLQHLNIRDNRYLYAHGFLVAGSFKYRALHWIRQREILICHRRAAPFEFEAS